VFDTITGKAVYQGYEAFPGPEEVEPRLRDAANRPVPSKQREKEKRILHTYYHLRCSVELEPF
jgi:hypothetical protein